MKCKLLLSSIDSPLLMECRYRKSKGWVKLILIRRVDDIAAIGIAEKNEPDRFEKAFKGIPKNAWHVFDSPEECYPIISEAIKRG